MNKDQSTSIIGNRTNDIKECNQSVTLRYNSNYKFKIKTAVVQKINLVCNQYISRPTNCISADYLL